MRNNTATKVLATTKTLELIDKRELAKVAIDENTTIFVVYFAALLAISTHPS